ncbi:MAG TPA: thermonuclease family protein [Aestuariivirgaceae bacterium]
MQYYWRRRYRQRSLWKIIADGAATLLLALAVLYVMDRFPQVDFLGSVRVTDGDSLRRGEQRIRLFGIDASELDQECLDATGRSYACGQEAKRQLTRLINNDDISCDVMETDKYRRDVARCRAGSVELNREMVRLGWAVAYARHSIDYLVAEATARSAGRGMWQGRFRRPEDFRSAQRETRGSSIDPEWAEID